MGGRSQDPNWDHRYTITGPRGPKPSGNKVGGGMDTARSKTPATAEEAAAQLAQQRDALAYLTRQGLADGPDSVAAILGLIDAPRRKRSGPAVVNGKTYPLKRCATCGRDFTPHRPEQPTCSVSCGRQHSVKTARATKARRDAWAAAQAQNLDTAGGASS